MVGKRKENFRNEDEIDVKELLITLWNSRKIIICLTLIFAFLAGILSMFVISPIYDTKLNIVISMPEIYTTRYGDYSLPITTNDQYIKLITSNDVLIKTIKEMDYNTDEITLEKLKEKISIEYDDTNTNIIQNSFEVTVSAYNPSESLKLAQTLYDNYIEFIDVMTKERAINYFINNFSMNIKYLENQLDITKDLLKKNEELLLQTPQIIEQGQSNIEINTQLTDESNYVIPIASINPNYIKIENDIVSKKQSINTIENSIMMDNKYLDELSAEKEAINKYYEAGQVEKLETSVIGVIETSIYLPSPPVAPTVKTSPSNLRNIAIGVVLGGFIGIMTALIKEFWLKKS